MRLSRREFLKGLGLAAGAVVLGKLGSVRGDETEPFRIGGLFPLTGSLSSVGPAFKNAAELAVEDLNGASGILGRKVELVVADTGTDPARGEAAARELIEEEKVVAIIGALASDVTLAAAQVSAAHEVVQISPASTSPELSTLDDDDFLFRTTISDVIQGVVQAELALNLGYHTVSLIYIDNSYGRGLAGAFRERFEQGVEGGEVLALIPYREEQPSYREEAEVALRWEPEAINLIAYPSEGKEIIQQLIEAGYEGEFLLSDGLKGPELLEVSEAIEGAFGTAPGSLETEVLRSFRAAYEMRYGQTPIPFLPQTYDAVILVGLAVQLAGSSEGAEVREALRRVANPPGVEVGYGELPSALELLSRGEELDYQGVSGPLTFDDRGDVQEGGVEIWTVHRGKIRRVWIAKVGVME
ncbi:MAG: ABC transporter substrate-binding protein [Candidatus Bipolaricaulia bacterium]